MHPLVGALDVNENVVAGMLVVVWPFGYGLGRLAVPERRWLAVGCTLISLFCVVVIALIPCRGAHVSLVLSASVWLVLLRKWPITRVLPIVALLALGVTVGLAFAWSSLQSSSLGLTARQRIEIWSRALDVIRAFPVTGVGLGNFQPLVLATQPLLLSKPSVTHAHNLYLQMAVDLGIPGATAYLFTLGYVLICGWSSMLARRTVCDQKSVLLLQTLLVSLCGMLVHGCVDAATWGNKLAFLPWVVMAATVSMAGRRPGTDVGPNRK